MRPLGLPMSSWFGSEIVRGWQLQWRESELAAIVHKFRDRGEEAMRCKFYLWSLVNEKQVQSKSWRAGI